MKNACPGCESPLVALELEGVEIDYCPECRGTWLDKGELAMIADLAEVASGGMTDALYSAKAGGKGKGQCPRCGAGLEKVSVGDGDETVELDRCPRGHGLWFDAGEMKAVIDCFGKSDEAEAAAVAGFFADMFRYELKERPGTDG